MPSFYIWCLVTGYQLPMHKQKHTTNTLFIPQKLLTRPCSRKKSCHRGRVFKLATIWLSKMYLLILLHKWCFSSVWGMVMFKIAPCLLPMPFRFFKPCLSPSPSCKTQASSWFAATDSFHLYPNLRASRDLTNWPKCMEYAGLVPCYHVRYIKM